MKRAKRIVQILEDRSKFEGKNLEEILSFVKEKAIAKFDESIDLSIKLGINPKKSDETIRSSFSLINGIKEKKKIAVFCESEDDKRFKAAGADIVGGVELIEQIKMDKSFDADVCLTTPDFFKKLVPIAKVLGTSGLMPNNKEGTITNNIEHMITEIQSGKVVKFKNDSAGFIAIRVGKASFSNEHILQNVKAFINYLRTIKPSHVKEIIKGCYLSSTMGTGIKVPLKFL